MFKRVERKRKRREEDEELGLDQDTRGTIDSDSDESDSGYSDADIGQDWDQEDDGASKDEGVGEDTPISVAEALKDPIYLISIGPTIHGCVLCKGKLIKNSGMAVAHKNANAHKRRFERFKQLSADADPRSNAWELVRAIRSASNVQTAETQEPSKRALKRQVKQAVIREKRKRHRELKAKAIAKKALKKPSAFDEARPVAPSTVNSPQNQSGKTRKKKRLTSDTTTIAETQNVTTKLVSRIETSSDSKKPNRNPRLKTARKASKPT